MAQRLLSNRQCREQPKPQHAGARFGAKVPHLARVTSGFESVAVAARRARAGSIGHAQDNCFAVFAVCVAHNSR
jgi:hypothetical protein